MYLHLPDATMGVYMCSCSRECKLETCQCLKYKLRCTQISKLKTCSNQRESENLFTTDVGNIVDDDEEDTGSDTELIFI